MFFLQSSLFCAQTGSSTRNRECIPVPAVLAGQYRRWARSYTSSLYLVLQHSSIGYASNVHYTVTSSGKFASLCDLHVTLLRNMRRCITIS